MATKINAVCVILLTLLGLSLLGSSFGQGSDHQSRGSRRRPRNRQSPRGSRGRGLPMDLEAEYLNAVVTNTASTPSTPPPQDEGRATSAVDPWHRFIPSTPTASEVECYFEVDVIRRQGGRCTRLGGIQRRAICLSGGVFDFVPECESVLAEREALADQENTTPEQ